MDGIIYRGAKEIGGTLLELKTEKTRILLDAGYPLFLNHEPIQKEVSTYSTEKLLELGVIPKIKGLYSWDSPSFDGVIISHGHIDHYGLLNYIHSDIPVYLSKGTDELIRLSKRFEISKVEHANIHLFDMYKSFEIGDMKIKPYLMDHSAFDAAAFEISAEGKTLVYSGDFRGHGRKAVCLDYFLEGVKKEPDVLFMEGSLLSRSDEKIITEAELEEKIVDSMKDVKGPLLFQCSSQNIDRLVSFYRAARRLNRIFVVDVYTANILNDLRKLKNGIPYPSRSFSNIKVFFPRRLTQKIFDRIGADYAQCFSEFHISRERLREIQNRVVMISRPSMEEDLERCKFQNGVFLYSLWEGYRDSEYQKNFEETLQLWGFSIDHLHTSGHAKVADIQRVIQTMKPKRIIPIHSLNPEEMCRLSDQVELKEDGEWFEV